MSFEKKERLSIVFCSREEAFNPSPKPGLEERISAPLPTAGGAITCLNQEVGLDNTRIFDKLEWLNCYQNPELKVLTSFKA